MKNIIMKSLFLSIIGLMLVSSGKKPCEVFLVGDSISIEYYPYLKEYTKDYAIIDRKTDDGKALQNLDIPMGANGGDSRRVMQYIKSRLEEPDFKPDYLLMNCGMHDIKRNIETNEIQVTQKEYRANLSETFRLLKKKKIQPIWIRSTWVVDSIHNNRVKDFRRYNSDVIEYNKIADDVCNDQGIPMIDLYNLSKNMGSEYLRDHAHYEVYAQKEQAAFIAKSLRYILKIK